jgi:DNA polymerase-3 subunit epsilon
MRLIFVDTETTGISPIHGHRIVEIACIETIDGQVTGREFHYLINPDRHIPPEASEIHGIHDEMVQDKPFFTAIADELMAFISSGMTVMHNAPFDVGFFHSEFERLGIDFTPLTCLEAVTDTLPRFRSLHPGARCTLSALCERHGIKLNEGEEWHGALTDARMLARLWQACWQQLPTLTNQHQHCHE